MRSSAEPRGAGSSSEEGVGGVRSWVAVTSIGPAAAARAAGGGGEGCGHSSGTAAVGAQRGGATSGAGRS